MTDDNDNDGKLEDLDNNNVKTGEKYVIFSPIKKTGKTIMTTKKTYFQPVEVKKLKFEQKTKHSPVKVLKDIIWMEDKQTMKDTIAVKEEEKTAKSNIPLHTPPSLSVTVPRGWKGTSRTP